jgi:hypothetical protein
MYPIISLLHPHQKSHEITIFVDDLGFALGTFKKYPLVNQQNYEKSQCLMGKSTINGNLQ